LRALALILLISALLAPTGRAGADAAASAGEAIYQRGVLGSGELLKANRDDGLRIQGADAACAKCHRRSGLGSYEGRISMPPITGRYLFHPRARSGEDPDLPYVAGMRGDRDPYTDASLARAIREGLNSEGKPLNYLMPNFALNDADMAALVAYLKGLDQPKVPGVTDTVLHFATIITPDADPVKRRGMLDVLAQFFADRNARQLSPTLRLRASGKTAYSKTMFKVRRRWELHLWELTGAEATWQEQLERHLAAEPVLAVISGLGGKTWAPVEAFCEREALPCLFPNVEAPPAGADRDVYSLYFSKGVLLEADLIANRILNAGSGKAAKAVHQIYRAGDSGEAAAEALAAALEQHGLRVSSHVLANGAPGQGVAEAVREASNADALVLWLRPADVAALGDAPATPASVFMSGLLGGLERSPLPSGWRERTRLAYPVDLPERRRVRVDFALGWFRIRHIAVVADQVQADTYLACGLLSETLTHMVDTVVRDYLIERIQDMLEHRIVTGYYPRLALASGQRFASKGGYIVRFAEAQGTRLIADHDWLVP
jgi:nucleotide-binding universal stress UspA family protein